MEKENFFYILKNISAPPPDFCFTQILQIINVTSVLTPKLFAKNIFKKR